MKIFYAIQATGNGHISRAMELLPYLQAYGAVDIFLSGANSNLAMDAPVKYRSNGVSLFYTCNGGLDHFKFLKEFSPLKLRKEIQDLPVEKYDLIINDFEYITSAACARKKVPSVHFGHQASFQSFNTPRPESKSRIGEWILKNYARASHYVGLHFESYDDFIFTPVIKKEILEAEPSDKNYITVYLSSYCKPQLQTIFENINDCRFEIFTKEVKHPEQSGNIHFLPIDKSLFNQSLIQCSGIITGGGFETPAEALHLNKKIMSIPIRGQYEQLCNASALGKMGITCKDTIGNDFKNGFYNWMNSSLQIKVDYSRSIEQSLNHVFSIMESVQKENYIPQAEVIE
jgi:uncharacterized protein (TIGR00661 family)